MVFSYFLRIIFLFIFLYVPSALSKLDLVSDVTVKSQEEQQVLLHDNEQKMSYALGISLGNYINQSIEKQVKIGVQLNKSILLLGVKDALLGHMQLSSQEMVNTLHLLEEKIKLAEKIYLEREKNKNLIAGKLYMHNFVKKKGVKKTESGLLYLIERKGNGEILKDNTKVIVHYKGTFTNGVEFDNSYARGKPISISLQNVIEGWKEGLRHIRKGGKIKLVIPPHLAYGEDGVNGIPANSTIIFDIELLDTINIE